MTMRLRRPAYAAQLQARREAGQHPWGVQVIVGDDWRPHSGCPWPRVAVKLQDWQPGRVDWRVCAGVPVKVIDRIKIEPDATIDATWPAWIIAGELAEIAASVQILHPASGQIDDVEALAWAYRLERFPCQFPAWWSRERELRYARNRERWQQGMLRWIDAQERRTGT